MILIATVPARTIVEGIVRSTFPGPRVMTSIWPMATTVKKLPKMNAAVSSPSVA